MSLVTAPAPSPLSVIERAASIRNSAWIVLLLSIVITSGLSNSWPTGTSGPDQVSKVEPTSAVAVNSTTTSGSMAASNSVEQTPGQEIPPTSLVTTPTPDPSSMIVRTYISSSKHTPP